MEVGGSVDAKMRESLLSSSWVKKLWRIEWCGRGWRRDVAKVMEGQAKQDPEVLWPVK